jgi:T5SS/PEP-CTERM-associated repeat protein
MNRKSVWQVGLSVAALWSGMAQGTIVTTGSVGPNFLNGLETYELNVPPATCGGCPDGSIAAEILVPGGAGGTATLEVNGGSTLTIDGDGQYPGIQIGRVYGPPANGTVTVTGAGSRIDIEGNNAFINVARNDQGTLNVLGGGKIRIESTSERPAFLQVGRSNGANGSMQISGVGSEVTLKGAGNQVSAVYVGKNANSVGTLTIDNGGKLSVADANGSVIVGRDAGASGSVTVEDGSSLEAGRLMLIGKDFAFDLDNDKVFGTVLGNGGSGTVTVNGSGSVSAQTIEIGAQGTLGGTGTVIGNVINDAGTVAPGNSPGTLTVDGDFTVNAGKLVIEVAGVTPGLFDFLDISGTADFNGGTIEIAFIDGFAPMTGQSFEFFNAHNGIQDLPPAFAISGLADGFLYTVSEIGGLMEFTALNDGISAPVPLPPAVLLLLAPLAGLSFARKKHRVHDTAS